MSVSGIWVNPCVLRGLSGLMRSRSGRARIFVAGGSGFESLLEDVTDMVLDFPSDTCIGGRDPNRMEII